MAKRKNFPKPLYLSLKVIERFRMRFNCHLRLNFFSGIYVYTSSNIRNKSIPYLVGELNGMCVNDSWPEEKNNFTVFIASSEDYQNAIKGNYSDEFLFFIDSVNKRQSLVDEKGVKDKKNNIYKNRKITANVYIVLESSFISYHKDRSAYIDKWKISSFHFNEEQLLEFMHEKPKNELF